MIMNRPHGAMRLQRLFPLQILSIEKDHDNDEDDRCYRSVEKFQNLINEKVDSSKLKLN